MNDKTHEPNALSINCTVVELKPIAVASALLTLFCINCTVVELKHCFSNHIIPPFFCINCTVVELKHRWAIAQEAMDKVLIVPLWN